VLTFPAICLVALVNRLGFHITEDRTFLVRLQTVFDYVAGVILFLHNDYLPSIKRMIPTKASIRKIAGEKFHTIFANTCKVRKSESKRFIRE